jgi:hypothetical protein
MTTEVRSLSRACGGGLGWGCFRKTRSASGIESPTRRAGAQLRARRVDLPRERERCSKP